MNPRRLFPVLLLLAGLAAGCASGGMASGLVVIPPDVAKAQAPEGKWQGIHAIYLYNIGYVTYDPIDVGFASYPSYAYSRFAKVKLLTRASTEGGMFGNIRITHRGDLYEKHAKVIKPDGTETELKDSDYVTTVLVKDVIPNRTPPIDLKETQIIFPGLEPGDVIEYSYTSRDPSLLWLFSQVDAPVIYSKFMVARPQGRVEIQPVIYDPQKLDPQQGKESGMATGMAGYLSIGGVSHRAVYDIWTATDIAPIPFEEAMPPLVDVASGVQVWHFDKRWAWSTLGETYYKWFTHYGRYPSRAAKLAKQVIAGISDPRDRAKAIHDWVKKTLIIQEYAQLTPVPRSVEIETIDIDELMEEKNATPERVANLMWLMMHEAGVDATLVLAVHDETFPALEKLPSIYQFTHPLLALDDGTMIDTTNRLCPFGMVPWRFEGRKALWVKAGSVSFRDLPVSKPRANQRTIEISGSIDAEGVARVEAKYHMTGQMAYAWRKWLVPMRPKEREDSTRDIVTITAQKAEVDSFTFNNLEDPDKPLEVVLKYHVPGYSQLLRDKMVLKTGAFIHHTACPVLKDSRGLDLYVCPKPMTEKRFNAVRFPFLRFEEMKAQINFPPGFLLQALPKGFRTRHIAENTSVGARTSYGSDGGKNLIVLRQLSVNQPLVDKQGYPKLRDLIRRYQAQKDTLVTLELPKMD